MGASRPSLRALLYLVLRGLTGLPITCVRRLYIALDPRNESLVGNSQYDRADKNADETESDKTTDDAGKNEQQRQVRAFSDQHGTQAIIHRPGDDHPHQHECSPGRFTDPSDSPIQ